MLVAPVSEMAESESRMGADSAIDDTGATSIYLTPKASCANINSNAPKILVGTAGGPPLESAASCNLFLPNLLHISGHIMPQFHHNLMGIGPLCDHGCRVLFEKKTVTVYSQDDDLLLRGWREPRVSRLWRFTLRPKGHTALPAACATERAQPSKRVRPCLLLACLGMISCALHLACGHQSRKFCLLARPHLHQCRKILPHLC